MMKYNGGVNNATQSNRIFKNATKPLEGKIFLSSYTQH